MLMDPTKSYIMHLLLYCRFVDTVTKMSVQVLPAVKFSLKYALRKIRFMFAISVD